MRSEGTSLSDLPPIKPEANSPEFGVLKLRPVQRKPPSFPQPASFQGLEPRAAGTAQSDG